MRDVTTIVLKDAALAGKICGTNDYNIRCMEALLRTPIRTKGNELYLIRGDADAGRRLSLLIEDLEERISWGEMPDPQLIRCLYGNIESVGEGKVQHVERIKVGDHLVTARSQRQGSYLKSMARRDLTFAVGPSGTGKTYLAVAKALNDVLTHRKQRLVLTRPVIETGEHLGFLPGDLAQKINPYLRPLYDVMDALIKPEQVRRLEEKRIIEVAPLAYMRGRSLNDCTIILDEAQNTTEEQMKMFLTRIGHNSCAIVTGDITQVDLPAGRMSGLRKVLDILPTIEQIDIVRFTVRDVVRSPLVQRIVEAYERAEAVVKKEK